MSWYHGSGTYAVLIQIVSSYEVPVEMLTAQAVEELPVEESCHSGCWQDSYPCGCQAEGYAFLPVEAGSCLSS